MSVVLSSWKGNVVLSGVHAAPGRQVSTWAHAVKAESQLCWGVVEEAGCQACEQLSQVREFVGK
jgi:hypothetical protein